MPRSPRSVAAGLAAIVLCALAVWRFRPFPGGTTDAASFVAGILILLAYLYLAAISVILAAIDLRTHRLPNAIVLPGYLVGAVLLGASAVVARDGGALLGAAIGAVAAFALFLLLALAVPGGLGFGDVKLAGVLGLFLGFLGWGPLAIGVAGGFVLGGLFAVCLLVARRAGRRSAIPFGPWLLAGAWLGIAAGAPLADAYLALAGIPG